MVRSRLVALVSVPVAAVVAAGVALAGREPPLRRSTRGWQPWLDFTKIFTAYTG